MFSLNSTPTSSRGADRRCALVAQLAGAITDCAGVGMGRVRHAEAKEFQDLPPPFWPPCWEAQSENLIAHSHENETYSASTHTALPTVPTQELTQCGSFRESTY